MSSSNSLQHKPLWPTDHGAHFPVLSGDVDCDVVVVGAGVAGLTAAFILKQEGLRVVVIDGEDVGGGETGKSTAHLAVVLDTRYHTFIDRFGIESASLMARGQQVAIDRIEDIVRSLRIECDFRRVPGYLYAGRPEQVPALDAEEMATAKLGLKPHRLAQAPLPFRNYGTLEFAQQAQLSPLPYAQALANAIDGQGSHVFTHTPVTAVDEGDLCRATTERGTVRGRWAVVATHVPINNRIFIHGKLASYRTYALAFRMPAEFVPGLFWDLDDPYHYIRTATIDGARYLIIGGEDRKVGEDHDTEARFAALRAWAEAGFGKLEFLRQWSGQIIETLDGMPYIGRNSFETKVLIATGFSGNGITQGTLAGIMLADEVAGRDNAWAALYKATRLPTGGAIGTFIQANTHAAKHFVADPVSGPFGDLASLPRGQGTLALRGGQKLAVYRDDNGALHALSPVCPHLGCHVQWNQSEKSWDCPCHGSRFDAEGHVLNGPAIKGLEERQLPPAEDVPADAWSLPPLPV